MLYDPRSVVVAETSSDVRRFESNAMQEKHAPQGNTSIRTIDLNSNYITGIGAKEMATALLTTNVCGLFSFQKYKKSLDENFLNQKFFEKVFIDFWARN